MARPHILIVEDDASIRGLVAAVASRMGMDKTTVSNGAEAIALLGSANTYCAVVLDLMMPEVDGYAVIDYLKKNLRLVPVVVATAAITTLDWPRLDPLIVKAVVTKPFDIDKLQAAIEAACEPLEESFRPPTDYEGA
jgi:CheY-like chemotaxis protein